MNTPICYVTRDIERALGLPLDTPGYFIIANSSPFANHIAKGHDNVLLIDAGRQLDTWELLGHAQVKQFIKPLRGKEGSRRHVGGVVDVVVFKPTKQIEEICTTHGWRLLNPAAELSANIEEKITQLTFLSALRRLFPPYEVTTAEKVVWSGNPLVVQFNHSHTGSGTVLISSALDLEKLQEQFPKRDVRTTDYIDGPLFTNNNVVTKDHILVGNISYQITGLAPFTDRPFATIGNDWALPTKLLTPKQIEEYTSIAETVGDELRSKGWKGLFGIDVVLEQKTGKLFLLEINARQPASTAFEAQLQSMKTLKHENMKTIFETHLAALLDTDLVGQELISIDDGAQIIFRNQDGQNKNILHSAFNILPSHGFTVIPYPNTKPGSDLLRIQSPHGIMADHNKFNSIGEKILKAIV